MADKRKAKGRKYRSPKLTRIEKLTKGLLAERDVNAIFAVKELKGKGRGVFLRIPILHKDSFVLEYEGDIISEAEAKQREKIYAHNNEGCFIMSFIFQGAKMAIDATRKFDSLGRLLNHSREPNVRFHSPFVIDLNGGLPRIASYALRDIYKGEEIVIDYGVRDGEISWLRNREIGFTADVDSDSSDESDCNSSSSSSVECLTSLKIPSLKTTFPDSDASCSLSSDVMSAKGLTQTRKKTSISEWNKTKSCIDGTVFSKGDFGARFTKLIPGGDIKTYFVGFEGIALPQKILKLIEVTSERKKKEAEYLDCLSSCSSYSSKKRGTSLCSYKQKLSTQPFSEMLGRTSGTELPSNKALDSFNKVLEWQITSPPLGSTMDVKIINVHSLYDSSHDQENTNNVQGNINCNLSSSYRQHINSAFQAQDISASSYPHVSHLEKSLQVVNQNNPDSVSSFLVLPVSSSSHTSKNTDDFIVTLNISDSDEESESSSSISSIQIIEPEPNSGPELVVGDSVPEPNSGPELVVGNSISHELPDVYVVSDDECVVEESVSNRQQSVSERKLEKERCSEDESSSSECEIILTEVLNPSSDLGLPARRPVGFSAPSAQHPVAVIKPFVSPSANGSTQKELFAMTESELQRVKNIVQHLDTDRISPNDVKTAVESNWDFFSVLLERGISTNQIRSVFYDFYNNRM